MFTGIIQAQGTVRAATRHSGRLELEIGCPTGWSLTAGDSIAVSGVCLTITDAGRACFRVESLPETLARTNLGMLVRGAVVNLERALRAGDPLGGHWVQGHIDGIGKVAGMKQQGDAVLVEIAAAPDILAHVVSKGSIAVDGVSLTVVEKGRRSFRVMIIPFTMERTVFKAYRRGSKVNLECDILSKYVAEHVARMRS